MQAGLQGPAIPNQAGEELVPHTPPSPIQPPPLRDKWEPPTTLAAAFVHGELGPFEAVPIVFALGRAPRLAGLACGKKKGGKRPLARLLGHPRPDPVPSLTSAAF